MLSISFAMSIKKKISEISDLYVTYMFHYIILTLIQKFDEISTSIKLNVGYNIMEGNVSLCRNKNFIGHSLHCC